jgi:hypothetical protein
MAKRYQDICRWAVGLLAMGAMLALVAHDAVPHQHSNTATNRNCPICQRGDTPVLQPTVQAETDSPSVSEPNYSGETCPQVAEPVLLAGLSRSPPVHSTSC